MDDADLEELRMLRARAYGPAADIGADPAAARRLRELEVAGRRPALIPTTTLTAAEVSAPRGTSTHSPAAHPTPAAHPDPNRRPGPSPRPPLPADPAAEASRRAARAAASTRASPADRAPTRRTRTRQRPLPRRATALWLASLVIVATAASAVTFITTRGGPANPDAELLGTIEQASDVEWKAIYGDQNQAHAFTFHGLTLIAGASDLWGAPPSSHCLSVYITDNVSDDGVAGPFYTGCGAGTLPPTVQLVVDENAPMPLREFVKDGTALRFVAQGERIEVFSSSPDEKS